MWTAVCVFLSAAIIVVFVIGVVEFLVTGEWRREGDGDDDG